MANTYTNGQQVRSTVTFTVGGSATDPTTVVAKVMAPDGTVTTYAYGTDAELVKNTTGVYYVDITGDQDGPWNYRFVGTGTCVAASEGTFYITSKFQ